MMSKTWLISTVLFMVVLSTGLIMANQRARDIGGDDLCIVASPQTVVLGENSTFVTIHSNILRSSVETVTLTLTQGDTNVTLTVPEISTWADDLGDLVVRFNLAGLGIVAGEATLTLSAVPYDDVSTVITVKDYAKK